MDTITVTGIRAYGYHGVLAHETEYGQEFIVDITCHGEMNSAAVTDDLAATVNYAEVSDIAYRHLTGTPHRLLERLADVIADDVLALAGVMDVEVVIHKPRAPIPHVFGDVTVRRFRHGWVRTVLGLGSNLGDQHHYVLQAIDHLTRHPDLRNIQISPLYRTTPVGGPEQGDFCNAVLRAETQLTAWELLALCQDIEQDAGRTREVKWGPRTLDVDIEDYAGEHVSTHELILPHPRAAQRAFVLVPWATVGPHDRIGRRGKTVAELAAAHPDHVDVRPW